MKDPNREAMTLADVEEIRTILTPVLAELRVLKSILFGSTSRGTGTRKSDVDLLLIVDTDERFFDRYGRFEKIYGLLKGRSVDLLIYTPEELDRIAHRTFIRRILDEGRTIYEH